MYVVKDGENMETIYCRRSIRKYDSRKVEPEKIDKMLRAAMQAPSAGNQQPWEFLVVEDKGHLVKMSKIGPYAGMLMEAPLAIIVLGNLDNLRFPMFWEQDLGAATQNLLLQAADEGLGAVWIGVAPIKKREEVLNDMFRLPEHVRPFCIIAMGYPAKGQENYFTDRFKKEKVHYETYQR